MWVTVVIMKSHHFSVNSKQCQRSLVCHVVEWWWLSVNCKKWISSMIVCLWYVQNQNKILPGLRRCLLWLGLVGGALSSRVLSCLDCCFFITAWLCIRCFKSTLVIRTDKSLCVCLNVESLSWHKHAASPSMIHRQSVAGSRRSSGWFFVVEVCASSSQQYSDTVGWVTVKVSSRYKTCENYPQLFFSRWPGPACHNTSKEGHLNRHSNSMELSEAYEA